MITPRCGCCRTGAGYIRRHIDPANVMSAHVDSFVMAWEWLRSKDMHPSHCPDAHILAAWIRERQAEKRGEVPAA